MAHSRELYMLDLLAIKENTFHFESNYKLSTKSSCNKASTFSQEATNCVCFHSDFAQHTTFTYICNNIIEYPSHAWGNIQLDMCWYTSLQFKNYGLFQIRQGINTSITVSVQKDANSQYQSIHYIVQHICIYIPLYFGISNWKQIN